MTSSSAGSLSHALMGPAQTQVSQSFAVGGRGAGDSGGWVGAAAQLPVERVEVTYGVAGVAGVGQ